MGLYRRKPVVIEAFQMTKARRLDNSEWPEWLNQAWQKRVIERGSLFCSADGCLETDKCTPLFLQTPQGTRKIFWDDWIIREHTGELCACSPRIFKAANEAVEVAEPAP